ncbi:uncharacterized protein LOC119309111 [Triticum dicoccoides]|uniref:uncharacterized protein LOC119309111 n=1 Tax=Triticum dicoccoides TaxID=85692 RepID=UPI001891DE08|nr:uncharacterized protein LOC119309111 [Triticum dicoccoides]
MGRGHVRPNMGLDLGSGFGAADAQAGQGSSRKRVGIDARRSDTVNLDDEDDGLIRNGSATREAPFKGLKTNDIHHVWNHGPKHGGGFHCRYCNMKNSGGGATRFKEHLGKIVGEVKECPNVPRNVHDIMRKAVLEMRKKKREKESRKLRFERELMDEMYQRNGVIKIDDDKDEEIHMALRESLRDRNVLNVSRAVERRRGSGSGVCVSLGKQSITAYFDKQLSSNKVSMQPKISTAMDSSSRDAAAMKITQNLGAAPIPTGKEIDGKYLDKNYEESREWLKLFKQDWKNYGMFFHKSIDASGQSQNSEFLYREIKQVVVEEIGHENVVQIVTDNGSNYKKACKTLVEQPEFSHIVWQPCAAHTVNLMLKDIGKFPEVDVIVKSAKQICRFFYNHNNLHDSMRKNVGGELIKPNATRFGTVFMFLESYLEKKDKFRKWMVSDDWKNSIWKNDADHVFAEELLSSNMWWTALEWVLDLLEPLYVALRYADTQKKCTLSGFKKTMMTAIQKMSSHLGGGSQMLDRVMSKVSPRMEDMQNETLMVAAAVLDPFTHYRVNLSNLPEYASALTDVIEKIADPESALLAINEISTYRECRGRFRHSLARSSAERMAPTEWWFQFGGEVPNLQKWALRIVSQCVSSSGCERNWTAFALVHTKQRNRLLYCKLHKSVSVCYNLIWAGAARPVPMVLGGGGGGSHLRRRGSHAIQRRRLGRRFRAVRRGPEHHRRRSGGPAWTAAVAAPHPARWAVLLVMVTTATADPTPCLDPSQGGFSPTGGAWRDR